MNERKVTVCIITYNQQEYIRDAIEGVLKQKEVSLNVLIYDDCSTDDTAKICREYEERYPNLIKVVSNPYNVGIIENTKRCFMAATADYIALCEGDDYWVDEYKLRDQISILQGNPDISLVHTNWYDKYGNKEEEEHPIDVTRDFCEHSDFMLNTEAFVERRNQGIRFSSICVRKNDLDWVIENHNLFSPKFSTVDVAFFLEFSQLGKFRFINRPTVVYRLHDGSVSVNSDENKQCKFMLGVVRIWDYYFELFNIKKEKRSIRLKNMIPTLSSWAFRTHNKECAKELREIIKRNNYKLSIKERVALLSVKTDFIYYLMNNIYYLYRKFRSRSLSNYNK